MYISVSRSVAGISLDGLDTEVQADQAENKAFQILHQVVEHTQAFGVLRCLHVREGPDLGCGEGNVLLAADHFELLSADPVRRGPMAVVLLENLAVLDRLP